MIQYYKIEHKYWLPQYIKVINRYTKYSWFLWTPTEYIVYEVAWYIAERISKLSSITIICELTEEEYNRYEEQENKLNSMVTL